MAPTLFYSNGPYSTYDPETGFMQHFLGQPDRSQENGDSLMGPVDLVAATNTRRAIRRYGTDGANDDDYDYSQEREQSDEQARYETQPQHATGPPGPRLTFAQLVYTPQSMNESTIQPATSSNTIYPPAIPDSTPSSPGFWPFLTTSDTRHVLSGPPSPFPFQGQYALTSNHLSASQITLVPAAREISNFNTISGTAGTDEVVEDDVPRSTGHTAYDDDLNAEEIEATNQAGDGGSITVDSDDLASDAGYESDGHSSVSSSLASSIRNYPWENGRRYHKYREGRYNFPNDDDEQLREDMKHTMVKMVCGNVLHFAPIGPMPQEILDIGTGTGIWAIEMGDKYSSANILGIDLSPIQPGWVPPNVRFMVDDAESEWLQPPNYFDYVHMRHTIMAIKNWPKLMQQAFDHIRPGGWMEVQEINHFPISSNDSMTQNHPAAQFWNLINEALTSDGVDFKAASNGRLVSLMKEAGFVNVTEKVFHVPIGTWPKNKVLKQVGVFWRTILLNGLQAIAMRPLTKLGWSPAQVEIDLIEVRKAHWDNSTLMYMPMHIVYGQKPGASRSDPV